MATNIADFASFEQLLCQILEIGLLRIRSSASAGLPDLCFIEADHLHNIPSIIASRSLEGVLQYLTHERHGYTSDVGGNVGELSYIWGQLEQLAENASHVK